METIKKQRQRFTGTVVSAKMAKTLVVQVDRLKKNAKYHKQYIASKKYSVHDEKGGHKEGDKAVFVSCRPLSKTKRWRIV